MGSILPDGGPSWDSRDLAYRPEGHHSALFSPTPLWMMGDSSPHPFSSEEKPRPSRHSTPIPMTQLLLLPPPYPHCEARRKRKCQLLSHVRLFVMPRTVALQAPLSMGFSIQDYWSGLPFPSPGDLPEPGIKPGSPALQACSLPSEPPGKPYPLN